RRVLEDVVARVRDAEDELLECRDEERIAVVDLDAFPERRVADRMRLRDAVREDRQRHDEARDRSGDADVEHLPLRAHRLAVPGARSGIARSTRAKKALTVRERSPWKGRPSAGRTGVGRERRLRGDRLRGAVAQIAQLLAGLEADREAGRDLDLVRRALRISS